MAFSWKLIMYQIYFQIEEVWLRKRIDTSVAVARHVFKDLVMLCERSICVRKALKHTSRPNNNDYLFPWKMKWQINYSQG